MTLDELKAYRAKCEGVQNTIKADIAYIEGDIQKHKEQKLSDWKELLKKLSELVELLPEGMPEHFGASCKSEHGEDYLVEVGNIQYNLIGSRFYEYGVRIWFRGTRLRIVKGGWEGAESGCNTTDDDRIWLAERADEIYELAKKAVADCHKAYNNFLVKKNKELLDKAEELHN